jgi:hypothetical protein
VRNVLLFLFFISVFATKSVAQDSSALHSVYDGLSEDCGYANAQGEMVIPFRKYSMCYTDTFRNFAIVFHSTEGIVGIDKNEKILFHVFIYDNGPDYPQEGLFRIIENDKIGYADTDGKIVIRPQYDCAYPFENGQAKVGIRCIEVTGEEHSEWLGGEWSQIDHQGNLIK